MIDPTSSTPESSPKSFFRIILFVLIALFIAILCWIGGYLLSQPKETKSEKSDVQFKLIKSTETSNKLIPLSAPDIAPITTEEEVSESHSKNRLELTDKAIDALSKHKKNKSSSSN